MVPFNFKKQDLLSKLNSLLPGADKYDAAVLKEHRKAEEEYLRKFRAAVRAASKWTYEEAKQKFFRVGVEEKNRWGGFDYASAPGCPVSRKDKILSAIRQIEIAPQERFTITHNGKYSYIYAILTIDVPRSKAMC